MKSFVRRMGCVLMTLAVGVAALGSSSNTLHVRAEELNIDPNESDEELVLGAGLRSNLDVCFYILEEDGEELPEEPENHFSLNYSSPIRINGAVSRSSLSLSTGAVDGQEDNLLADGFTASNEVSQMLSKLPTSDDVKSVVGDFDESSQYVIWYVIKQAWTWAPNSDVFIHVDGVIRDRQNVQEPDPEAGDDPVVVEEPTTGEKEPEVVEEPTTGEKEPVVAEEPTTGEKDPEVVETPDTGKNVPEVVETPETGDNNPAVVPKPGTGQDTETDSNKDQEVTKDSENDSKKNQEVDKNSEKEKETSGKIEETQKQEESQKIEEPQKGEESNKTEETQKAKESESLEESKIIENNKAEEDTESVTEDPIPDVTLEIRALFMEDGVEVHEIEYDGREHIIGGFEIVVNDKESGRSIVGYLYDCFGAFLGTKAYADEGYGTEFTYENQSFWVNVVKAFARITNPGDSQEVIFYDSNDNPLRDASDFIIRDSAGKVIPAKFNVVATTAPVSVNKRELTIEAGTSVMNDNGQTLTDDSYEIKSGSLLEGHRIETVVINGSQTGPGQCPNEITSVNIVDEQGRSVNNLYNIKSVNGTLMLVEQTGNTGVVKEIESSFAKETSTATIYQSISGVTVTSGNITQNATNTLNTASGTVSAGEQTAVGQIVVGQTIVDQMVADTANDLQQEEAMQSPVVLGERRAETSDPSGDLHVRILILTMCFAISVFMLKRENE